MLEVKLFFVFVFFIENGRIGQPGGDAIQSICGAGMARKHALGGAKPGLNPTAKSTWERAQRILNFAIFLIAVMFHEVQAFRFIN